MALLVVAIGGDRAWAAPGGGRQHLSPALAGEKASLERTLGRIGARLETRLARDALSVTEDVYKLERRSIRWLLDVANGLSGSRRAVALEDARALVRRVRQIGDRIGEHAIHAVRAAIPGEQLTRLTMLNGLDAYFPIDRVDSYQSHESKGKSAFLLPASRKWRPAADMYREHFQAFLQRGGRPQDLRPLTPAFLRSLRSGDLVNFTLNWKGPPTVTTAAANHIVLAGKGQAQLKDPELDLIKPGAGDFKSYKDARGRIVLVMASRSSGRYKPYAGVLEGITDSLARAGVPPSHVVTSALTPDEPLAVKLLLMSQRAGSSEQIRERLEALRREADR
jgi:hypothetical protein